ncbi:aspartyl/lysyl-trna synthetase [Holotrichia oblita]|nr:aspartyl/lysyl-trna synthetase [Holotrichia oblita]
MIKTQVYDIFKDSASFNEKDVTIAGWVRSNRHSNAFGFIELNDGSCFKSIQIVYVTADIENFDEISRLNVGGAIIVRGKIVLTPDAKQPFEVKAAKIDVEGHSTPDYPLQKKRHSVEFLREIAHLRPRTNLIGAAMRVRSEAAFAIHKFFNERNFVYVHTPIITASDCEGAGEMFRVTTLDVENPLRKEGKIDFGEDFFCKNAFLTVSGQLNGEAYALAYGNIYTFGPTFRAENSNTNRHAAEFWMIEPEIAFADLNDDMRLAEDMMKYVVSHVLEKCSQEISFFNEFMDKTLSERLVNLVNSSFAHVTYTEAINLLIPHNASFAFPVKWGSDIQTEHERYLSEVIFKEPVFVTDYPKEIKSFYMRMNDDNKTVAAMDMLVPGVGELIGGSQREERLDLLLSRMKELHLNEKDYWWYLDLRRYGGTRHAGFGIGFERLIMYLTGITNIRDVIPFPRTVGSAEF